MPPREHTPPVVLDLAAERLLVGERPVDLRPKTWDVLRQLAGRAGKLVTKNELLDGVWADTAVTGGTLSKSIGELRVALGDDASSPRWIETVPRRGFRWIGNAKILDRRSPASGTTDSLPPSGSMPPVHAVGAAMIARAEELARLESALSRARSGRRQIVFVSGEAGAGKTLLTDSFLERLSDSEQAAEVLVAHGQCLETFGTPEPYLPFLDGLERLARDRRLGATVDVLRRVAPSWAARMPALASTEATTVAATSPGSALRELAGAIDELAADRTLVLVLEDAHWADIASTDALAALAKRRDEARLLVVVTMREAEAVVAAHPLVDLRREILSHERAQEIRLAPFPAGAIREYLSSRCPGLEGHESIAEWLLQQTAGNPLFVRLVVDDWITRGLVARTHGDRWEAVAGPAAMRETVPESFRALLDGQLAALASEERVVAEAASVRIGEFFPASIAAAAAMTVEEVDAVCDRIAQRGRILRHCGTAIASDGTTAEQYAFLHATVQNVVCRGISRSARRRLHLAAATQLESEREGRLAQVSSLLAVHYEEAGDAARAVHWLREAAREAMHRDAPRDAVMKLERALELIGRSPHLPDPNAERVLTLSDLTHARQLAFGFSDPKVAELWSRATELAESIEDLRDRVIANSGAIVAACVTGRYADAHDMMRAIAAGAERVADAGAKKLFAFAIGNVLYRTGATVETIEAFESAIATVHENDPVPGADLDALLLSQCAPALAVRGRLDDVRSFTDRALERAKGHSHYAECVTGSLSAWSLGLSYDFEAGAPIAERTIELAKEHGFVGWDLRPLFVAGMARLREGKVDEALARFHETLDGRRNLGHLVDESAVCCLFAEALLEAGRDGAAELLEQASSFVASQRAVLRIGDPAAPGPAACVGRRCRVGRGAREARPRPRERSRQLPARAAGCERSRFAASGAGSAGRSPCRSRTGVRRRHWRRAPRRRPARGGAAGDDEGLTLASRGVHTAARVSRCRRSGRSGREEGPGRRTRRPGIRRSSGGRRRTRAQRSRTHYRTLASAPDCVIPDAPQWSVGKS